MLPRYLSTIRNLKEDFYEVEEVLGRWLCKNMTYEFQVRFKGYGPEDERKKGKSF